MKTVDTIALVLIGLGLLLQLAVRLAISGILKPNGLFGFRTPATMHDLGSWQAGHRAVAGPSIICSLSLLLPGAWLLVQQRLSPGSSPAIPLGMAIGLGLVTFLLGNAAADRGAHNFRHAAGQPATTAAPGR